MTQIEQIKAEIERLRNECAKSIGDGFVDGDLPKTMTSGGAAWVCEQLLSFIESMEKEYLPSNLDEAANNYGINIRLGYPRVMDEIDRYIYNAFKAGAEWMAGQGVAKEAVIGMATEEISINVSQQTLNELDLCPGDKVVVQIRKK